MTGHFVTKYTYYYFVNRNPVPRALNSDVNRVLRSNWDPMGPFGSLRLVILTLYPRISRM